LFVVMLLWAGLDVSAQTILQQFVSVGSAGKVIDMDLPQPSRKGSALIAMPGPITPGVKVVSITDNAPAGGNTYKQVPGSESMVQGKSVGIWYCENCNPDVSELKFHLSDYSRGAINVFLEVSDLALSSVLDGSGVVVSDGTGKDNGLQGPSIKTSAPDFIVGRFMATGLNPTGVTPAAWTYKTTHVFLQNADPGNYQPTLTGGTPAGAFCMSIAAFKVSSHVQATERAPQPVRGTRHFPY
jgi:hypothetical protein